MNKFKFSPENGLLDEAAFPTNPTTQQEARGQVQTPMNQLRDFINDKVKPTIDELETFKSELDGSLKGSNGYTKLPNGMLLQWGMIDTIDYGTKWNTFTYPIAFPNGCFSIVGTANFTGTKAYMISFAKDLNSPRHKFRVYAGDPPEGSTSGSYSDLYWIAIGY